MALAEWKIVFRKKGTKQNEIGFFWENNLKAIKKQLKKNGYKFVANLSVITTTEEIQRQELFRKARNAWFMYITGEMFDSGTGENQRPLTEQERMETVSFLSQFFERMN